MNKLYVITGLSKRIYIGNKLFPNCILFVTVGSYDDLQLHNYLKNVTRYEKFEICLKI